MGHPALVLIKAFKDLVLCFKGGPGVSGIEVINGAAIDDRIGQSIVVDPRGAEQHGGLGLANSLGRCRINAPVESENAGWVVSLQAPGLGRGG